MASRVRSGAASVVGWLIVIVVAFWLLGLIIGWISFVLRSLGWILLIGLLVVAYFAIKGPPDD